MSKNNPRQDYKVLLLGMSTSGKSTAAKILREKHSLRVIEVDDEALKMNNNVWPQKESLLDRLYLQIYNNVIKKRNLVFVTTWLEPDYIRLFKERGFKIVVMKISLEELVRRTVGRDKPTARTLDRRKRHHGYFLSIVDRPDIQKMTSLELDCTKMGPEHIARRIFDACILFANNRNSG